MLSIIAQMPSQLSPPAVTAIENPGYAYDYITKIRGSTLGEVSFKKDFCLDLSLIIGSNFKIKQRVI